MSDPIEGHVAAVVSAREVALNRGTKHGVEVGMTFAILAESPFEITDPEGGDVLGRIDREKVRVRITETQSAFSIARTFRKYRTPGGPLYLVGAGMFSGLSQAPVTRYQTLRVDDSELPPPLEEDESFVKRGDRIRQIIAAEENEASS